MLCSAKTFNRQKLVATDGAAGGVYDLLFHENDWRVSYVVVDVGTWLDGKRVLLLPSEVPLHGCSSSRLVVNLSKEELHRRPHIDTDPAALTPDSIRIPSPLIPRRRVFEQVIDPCARAGGVPTFAELLRTIGDDLVRSVNRTLGYRVECEDGTAGLVDDMILDVNAWGIRCLVLDVGTWLHPKKVLLPISRIGSVHWFQEMIGADVSKTVVRAGPSFECRQGIDPRCVADADAHFGNR